MENLNVITTKLNENYVQVIPRNTIPAITEVVVEGEHYDLGTHQDFRRHPQLNAFIPDNGRFSVSWTCLKIDKILGKHQHPNKSMVLIIKGSGSLLGELNQSLKEGDTVIIPENCVHGFVADNGEDLYALSIQFDEGLYENIYNPKVSFLNNNPKLQKLLKLNKSRLNAHAQTNFFKLLIDGTLNNQETKKVFYQYLYYWSHCFQKILHIRQGVVSNEKFSSIYLHHFKEEFGHDEILRNEKKVNNVSVGVDIEAYASWFSMKALTGNDLEKIVMIHLVLETSAHAFHEIAAQTLSENRHQDVYFEIHKEADEEHSMLGIDLLANLSDESYHCLELFMNKAWDMLEAMLAKMDEIIRLKN